MAGPTERLPRLVQIPGRETWHIRHGKKRWSTGKVIRHQAEESLQQYIASLGGTGALRRKETITTVEQLLGEWKKEYLKGGAEKEANWHRNWKYLHATILRHATNTPVHLVDTEWADDYIGERLDEGVVGSTVRKELSHIRTAWELCGDRIELQKPKFNLPPMGDARDVFISPDQARDLVSAADKMPHTRMFIRLAWETAGRHGAILNLKWSAVDFDTKNIDLRPGSKKGGKRAAVVRVGDKMINILREARERAETPYVIELDGRAPLGSVKSSFRSCVQSAGLPAWVTPHILRHSSATKMARDGVDMHEIQGVLGHSSIETTTRVYAHHSPDHQSKSAAAREL